MPELGEMKGIQPVKNPSIWNFCETDGMQCIYVTTVKL